MTNSAISPPEGRKKGIPKEIFTRKPQALNSLSEDYSRISLEPGWQGSMASNTPMLLLSVMASKTGTWAFFFFFFFLISFFLSLTLFFWKDGRDVRRGGGQRSFSPSETQSWGLLPTSGALEVKHKNGRSQRPKKNDILLVTTPPSQGLCCGGFCF